MTSLLLKSFLSAVKSDASLLSNSNMWKALSEL